MPAYFIVDVKEITDPQLYGEYRKQVDATLAQYGGNFLVRGGEYENIEGDWQPQRLVVLQFDDMEHFKRWYYSPEYSKARRMRLQASTARAVVIQGVE
ncbi:DUF1330 domain-containing protein [Ktedonospora formicarum]|uniref:DUF1330 domain-containing protein n=1 Tax=Ktedonospora formicarum TaxID=2778364 RepID=A0A8J3I329_9CHLR|nr:DUF1330 domain-containing protein [Ktedonospora formicarum]GHO45945.1 hypothetical protein KSX_41080 [Ktedonospora formicarum]